MILGSATKVLRDKERSIGQRCYPKCPLVNKPQINLSNYAKRYENVARLIRLKFIAEVCPNLRVEALEMAIDQVKLTYNVKMYEELHSALCQEMKRGRAPEQLEVDNEAAASSSTVRSRQTESSSFSQLVPFDAFWVEDNTMEAALLRQELNGELNFKKSNSGTTHVRRILEEIGDYHVNCGNLQLAIKFYARTRPYCTSSENVINMFCKLIRVSIYMANWWHVLSYIEEAKQYASGFSNLAKHVPHRLSCAAGLANIGLKNYNTAAHCFLKTPYEGYEYDDIVARQDVAYFGVLCALATFELGTLHSDCHDSKTFKPFLDQSPKMWTILATYMADDYKRFVNLLHEIENRVRLDVYLAPHVDTLYKKIMNKIPGVNYHNGRLSIKCSTSSSTADEMETEVYARDLKAD